MPQYGPNVECTRCRKTIWADAQRFIRVVAGAAVTLCRRCTKAHDKAAAEQRADA